MFLATGAGLVLSTPASAAVSHNGNAVGASHGHDDDDECWDDDWADDFGEVWWHHRHHHHGHGHGLGVSIGIGIGIGH
ncbi:hypothetical protein AFR_34810 [Actinoplanes friuliensis DSM 7358]|uniref:Secreted protein n=2 Tax=Actinoplanes friuliensis TaxID=196914 RepID=U5W7P6_9ACTN|nr:hypothetical protein AFR_34810 [Actinoplanes friuliensis DSM 7358]